MDTLDVVERLRHLARCDPDGALREASEIVAGAGQDVGLRVKARHAAALARIERGQLATAATEVTALVAIATRAGLTELVPGLWLTLAWTDLDRGRLAAAERHLAAARPGLRGVESARGRCATGLLRCAEGRHAAALEELSVAIPALRRHGDRHWLANALIGRGTVAGYLGRLREADADFAAAVELYGQLGERIRAAACVHNRGFVALQAGDLPAALHLFGQAEAGGLNSGRYPEILIDRAQALVAAGMPADARPVLARAATLLAGAGRGTKLAEATAAVAHCALRAGQPKVAADAAARAVALFGRQGRTSWRPSARAVELTARLATSPGDVGLASVRKVAADCDRHGWWLAGTELRLAAAETVRPAVARALLAEVAERRHVGPAALRALGWLARARLSALGSAGLPGRARAARSVGSAGQVGSAGSADAVSSDGSAALVGTADSTGWVNPDPSAGSADAPGSAELAGLADPAGPAHSTGAANSAGPVGAAGRAGVVSSARVVGALGVTRALAGVSSVEAARAAGLADGRVRRAVLAACRAGLRAVDRDAATMGAWELQAGMSTHTVELAELGVRAAMAGGRPRAVLRWVDRYRAVSSDRPSVLPPADPVLAERLVALRSAIATAGAPGRVRRLEQQVRGREWAVGHQAADRSDWSFADLDAGLGNSVLISFLVHDGWFHALSYVDSKCRIHRLAKESSVNEAVRSLRFGETLALRGSASGGAARRSAIELDTLLFGPLADIVTDRPLIVVPAGGLHAVPWAALPSCFGRPVSVAPSVGSWLRAMQAPVTDNGERVWIAGPRLRHAAPEARSLHASHGGQLFVGRQATTTAALAAMDGAELVHVAAHGEFREDQPLFSAVDLSDGPLFGYDIQRLRRAPKVVVLSACDAGRAAVRPGGEVMGMAAALLRCGTTTVVASVLPVPDRRAGRLVTALHDGLRSGLGMATALAQAQATHGHLGFVTFGAG